MSNDVVLIAFAISALLIFAVESYLIEEKKKKTLNMLESNFLLGAVSFEQYKHQMLQIMEIVYEKAGESDPQFIKDFEKIKESINKKCDETGNLWVKNVKNSLQRETKYSNWEEAIQFAELVLKKMKNDNSRESNQKND